MANWFDPGIGALIAAGAWIVGASALGVLAGFLFHWLWRRVLPRARSRALLGRLPADVRGMLTAQEPSEMLRHYKAVLLGISSYGLRNAAALAAGLLPVAVSFLLLDALNPSGRSAAEIEVYPPAAVQQLSSAAGPWMMRDGRMLAAREDLSSGGGKIARGLVLAEDRLDEKQAWCASIAGCMLYEMMLFETQRLPELERSVVARPAYLDSNPVWPFVSDAELAFFIAVMLGSALAMGFSRYRGAA